MLLEEEQHNSIFNHMILMCLSWQFATTHSSAEALISNKMRVIPLGPVVDALGASKAEALPGFHAISGADITGRFAGKGKLTHSQALSRCYMEITLAFAPLGTSEELGVDTERAIVTFVCQLYEPDTTVLDVGDLRWKLFTKKHIEVQNLPPTQRALHEPLPKHITKPWYGIRMTFLTLSYTRDKLGVEGRRR